jgi:hypothetical protein
MHDELFCSRAQAPAITAREDTPAADPVSVAASPFEVLERVESAAAALMLNQLKIARQRESDAIRMYSTFQGLASVPPADLRHAEARADIATKARRALEQQVGRLAAKDVQRLRRGECHSIVTPPPDVSAFACSG